MRMLPNGVCITKYFGREINLELINSLIGIIDSAYYTNSTWIKFIYYAKVNNTLDPKLFFLTPATLTETSAQLPNK